MKKNLFKQIGITAATIALSLSMGTGVFAATTGGDVNSWNGIETSDNSISIAKQIVFMNSENTDVREPNIKYTYSLQAADPGSATVTDHNGISGTVKRGPVSAAVSTEAEVNFSDANKAAANADGSGEADIKYAEFSFQPSAFGAPGVYRYKISESSDSKAALGIQEADGYNADRYLDVYVSKTSNSDSTLKIHGYVLFEGSASESIASGDMSMKSAGFVNTAESGEAPEDVDVYRTHNLYIEKLTTGTMADPDNDFPVAITMTAADGVTAAPKIDVVLGGNGTLQGTASDDAGTYINFASTLSGTVDNGSSIYLKGIPEGTAASLKESNNTLDTYKIKAGSEAESADLLAEAAIAAGADTNETAASALNGKVNIFITGTLDQISPTGVVTRYAPYLFILGAAIVLLFGMRRRTQSEEE